jgi:hypothetical protein
MSRAVAWAAALCSFALGCVAALVGVLDTQRVCMGMFDEMCGGPKRGDAVTAFALAGVLLTLGVVLVIRLRRTRRG